MEITCRFADSRLSRSVTRAIVAAMVVTGAIPGGVAPRVVRASDVTPPDPAPPRPPIVGFADTHVHQFANLGFGGLEVWGSPADPTGDPALFGTSEEDPAQKLLRDAARRRALPNSDFIYLSTIDVLDYLGAIDIPVIATPSAARCDNGNCWPQCPAGTGVPDNPCWRVATTGKRTF